MREKAELFGQRCSEDCIKFNPKFLWIKKEYCFQNTYQLTIEKFTYVLSSTCSLIWYPTQVLRSVAFYGCIFCYLQLTRKQEMLPVVSFSLHGFWNAVHGQFHDCYWLLSATIFNLTLRSYEWRRALGIFAIEHEVEVKLLLFMMSLTEF